MVIAFFGHAQFHKKIEYEDKLQDFLEEKVGDSPADMYLGGYGEFDAFAYECCKKYKKTHPNIALIFVAPYMTLEYQRNHLDYLKECYDLIIYPEIEDKLPRFAIVYRNRWMVESSDYVVVGIDHAFGGAYNAYRHALHRGKPIFNITGNGIK